MIQKLINRPTAGDEKLKTHSNLIVDRESYRPAVTCYC